MTKEAKPDTWMPLMIGDYLKDTSRLTTEQHGAYLLLLMDYWTKGPPPDDDLALASITKLDARRWRLNRPTLVRFFRVEDGEWRQKRADEELVRWSEKKRIYSERASAGGRAKAARSTATSTPQAVLGGCTSSASREVEGLTGHSTLSGQVQFSGPKEVRAAFVASLGESWTASYIDRCAWQDIPDRALIPATRVAANKIIREGRGVLLDQAVSVLERAA